MSAPEYDLQRRRRRTAPRFAALALVAGIAVFAWRSPAHAEPLAARIVVESIEELEALGLTPSKCRMTPGRVRLLCYVGAGVERALIEIGKAIGVNELLEWLEDEE